MPIGIAVYTWYIEWAFSIYMVYSSISKKRFGFHAIYHVYRQTLYPMFSYVHPRSGDEHPERVRDFPVIFPVLTLLKLKLIKTK